MSTCARPSTWAKPASAARVGWWCGHRAPSGSSASWGRATTSAWCSRWLVRFLRRFARPIGREAPARRWPRHRRPDLPQNRRIRRPSVFAGLRQAAWGPLTAAGVRPFHLALAARRTAVRALSANHRSGNIGWHWDMRGLLDPQKADEARQETMTVIPIRARRAARPPRRPVEPPPALGKPAAASDPGDSGDDAEFYRLRARQNWAVLVLVIVLVLGGA